MTNGCEDEHEKLLEFLYACPVGLLEVDADGRISLMNPVAMQMLMPLGAAARGLNLFHTLADYAPDLRSLVQAFEMERGQICQGRRIHVGTRSAGSGGRPQVFSCTIVKLDNSRFMTTLEDVSEQVAQERRLRQAEAWFASLINEAEGFAVIGLDAEGRIETLNASARQQTGFEEAELIGKPLTVLDRADSASYAIGVVEEISLARRDGWYLTEGWSAKRDGTHSRCQRLISVRSETDGDQRQVTGFTVVLRPVPATRTSMEELRRRLTTDHLTGVCNRAYFFDTAEQERRRCEHADRVLGLVTLDIDHFKRVNDNFGHAVGDVVLQAVAKACAATLQVGDTFARLGGEEFVALLPGADAAIMLKRAEAMRAAVAAVVVMASGTELRATASFGCATDAAGRISVEHLLERADQALYRAKRNGRNCIEIEGGTRAVA